MTKKGVTTPPYVPRKGLRAVLDHIQARRPGDVLTREELHKRGLSSHWTYPAMAALRFLGILDEQDRLTGLHQAYSPDNPDRPAQEALLRKAYGEFFQKVPLPVSDAEVLKESFRDVYQLSERVNNSAFPIFQTLAEEAGLNLTLESPAPQRPDTARETSGAEIDGTYVSDEHLDNVLRQQAPGDEPVRIRHTGYQIVINLQVTKYTTEKDLIKMLRTANRAIHLLKKAGDRH